MESARGKPKKNPPFSLLFLEKTEFTCLYGISQKAPKTGILGDRVLPVAQNAGFLIQ